MELLKEHFKIKEEDWSKEVSDSDLKEISHSYCSEWRLLPYHLGMKDIVVKNIERNKDDEEERKHAFFRQWKQEKGFDATYKQLISALLKIRHREDAENVCKLLIASANLQHCIYAMLDITSAQKPHSVSSDSINVSVQNSRLQNSTQRDAAGIDLELVLCIEDWL